MAWPFCVGVIALLCVFCYGMFIFMGLEGWGALDSFYQTVITLSTVGFEEVHEFSPRAKFHTSFLILAGVGSFAYIVGSFTQLIVEGQLRSLWEKRRMQHVIDALTDHFLICGYGRIGSVVAKELHREGFAVVVIDNNPEVIGELEQTGMYYIAGDATSDEILLKAGLKRAKAIIAALDADAENVYVTLTSKQMVPQVLVVARAANEQSIQRLEYAGADRVLTPHVFGGLRMAQLVVRPTVTDFLDLAMQGRHIDLQMEELEVSPGSWLVGKDLLHSEIRPRFNLIVIAIQKSDGSMHFNPQSDTSIDVRDTLVVVGSREDLDALEQITTASRSLEEV
ncbi:MAG: potassium channel family protein [Thermodesulfobacteriota bacterium]